MVTTVRSKKTGAVRVIGKLSPGSTVGNVTIKQGTSYSTSRESLQNTAQYGGSARPSTPVSSQITGNNPNVINTDKEAARQQFLKQTLQNIERTKGVNAANAYRTQIQQSEYNRRANIINQSRSGSSSGVVKQGISTSGSPNYQDISGRAVYVAPQQTAQQAVDQQVQQELGQRYQYTPAPESQIRNALVNPTSKMANMSTERGNEYAPAPKNVSTYAKYVSIEQSITPESKQRTDRLAANVIKVSVLAPFVIPAAVAQPIATAGAVGWSIAAPTIAKYAYRAFDEKEGIVYDEQYNKGIQAGFQNVQKLYSMDTPFMKTAKKFGATEETPIVSQIETGSKALRNSIAQVVPSPGLSIFFGKENVDKAFSEGFLQYGSETDLKNALGEMTAKNIGQTTSLVGASAFIERGAQQQIAKEYAKGGVIPPTTIGKLTSTFKKTAPTFIGFGAIEGASNEISMQLTNEESLNISSITNMGVLGAGVATTLGVPIAARGSFPINSIPSKTIKYGLELPTNIADLSEPAGDFLEATATKIQYGKGARVFTPTIITTTNDKSSSQTFASMSKQKDSKYSQITPSPTYTKSSLLIEQETTNNNRPSSIVKQPTKQYTITNDLIKVPTPTTTLNKTPSNEYIDKPTKPRQPTKEYIITNDFVETPLEIPVQTRQKTQTNTVITTSQINTFLPQKFAILPPIGVVDAPGGEGKFSFGFRTEGRGKGQYLPSVAGIASGITISKAPTYTSGIGIRFPVMERPSLPRSPRKKQSIQVNINVLRKNNKTKNKTSRTKYRKSRR